jgi:hypothetical protein
MARFSKRSLEGEVYIDHRNSPGLPPEIAAMMGVPAAMVAKGQTCELAFYVCSHCDCSIIKNPERVRPRDRCQKCDQLICEECAALLWFYGECRERDKRLDTLQEQIESFGSPSPLLIGR